MHDSSSENLKPLHTFHLDVRCDDVIEVTCTEQVASLFQEGGTDDNLLILGKGSNVLFVEDYQGTVVLNRILGIDITREDESIHIHAGGGEDWPRFVTKMVAEGIGGFENLAMIPGCVGSSPIQNIGAYGVELKSLCSYVDYYDLTLGKNIRLLASDCEFGYRDSIFKHQLKHSAFITAVGFKVPSTWAPNLGYGALADSITGQATIGAVYDAVCATRMSKLPDPDEIGNAGSFFKNPVVSADAFERLQQNYPSIVGYSQGVGVKLAAGWLIDQAGFKGVTEGGAQVHPMQALVLTNTGTATPTDIVNLAQRVRMGVLDKFDVELEHEVRFITSRGETTLDALVNER